MGLGKKKILSQAAAAVATGTNFEPFIWTGDATARSITGVGTSADMLWFKSRTQGNYNPKIVDNVRGNNGSSVMENLYTSLSNAQANDNGITSLDSDGFSVASSGDGNGNNLTYVGWFFKGGGSSNIYNVDGTGYSTSSAASLATGTITPSGASVNTAGGFSIVSYPGNSTQNATIPHGLSSPKLTIVKNIGQGDAWFVGSTLLGTNQFLELNESSAKTTNSDLNYEITSTAFKTTSSSPHDMINQSGENYIMYTFADITGHQKIGTYSGSNSNLQVDTDFQPRFLLLKNIDASGRPWVMIDSLRTGYLEANSAAAEGDTVSNYVSFNSDGFLLVGGTGSYMNESGWDFLYLAIA